MTNIQYTFEKDGIQVSAYVATTQILPAKRTISYDFGKDTVLVAGKNASQKQQFDLVVEAARKD